LRREGKYTETRLGVIEVSDESFAHGRDRRGPKREEQHRPEMEAHVVGADEAHSLPKSVAKFSKKSLVHEP